MSLSNKVGYTALHVASVKQTGLQQYRDNGQEEKDEEEIQKLGSSEIFASHELHRVTFTPLQVEVQVINTNTQKLAHSSRCNTISNHNLAHTVSD